MQHSEVTNTPVFLLHNASHPSEDFCIPCSVSSQVEVESGGGGGLFSWFKQALTKIVKTTPTFSNIVADFNKAAQGLSTAAGGLEKMLVCVHPAFFPFLCLFLAFFEAPSHIHLLTNLSTLHTLPPRISGY